MTRWIKRKFHVWIIKIKRRGTQYSLNKTMEVYKLICLHCKEKVTRDKSFKVKYRAYNRQKNKYRELTTCRPIQNTTNIFNKWKTRQLMGIRVNFQKQKHNFYLTHILPSGTNKIKKKNLTWQHYGTGTITITHSRRQYRAEMCILHIRDTHSTGQVSGCATYNQNT